MSSIWPSKMARAEAHQRAIVHATPGRITVTEAHQRFGDLAQIRKGVTTWLEVEADGGVWRPVFDGGIVLVAYEWSPS